MAQPKLQRIDGLVAGRYRLLQNIGNGSQSSVWAANDLRLNRSVALKLANPLAHLGPERLAREAEILSSLDHPHIVRMFDSGSTDGTGYICMPFLDGETLRSFLKRDTPSPALALEWISQLCSAVDHIHVHGFVHRDLKPENIFILRHPCPSLVLVDFGLAAPLDSDHLLTGMLDRPGTAGYVDPAINDSDDDERRDIYSLGVIMGELYGIPLEDQQNDRWGAAPAALVDLVRRCTAPIEQRYSRVGQIEQALPALLVTTAEPSQRVDTWKWSLVLAATLAAFGGYLSMPRLSSPTGETPNLLTSQSNQACAAAIKQVEHRQYAEAERLVSRGMQLDASNPLCLLADVQVQLASYARTRVLLNLKQAEKSGAALGKSRPGTVESALASGLIAIEKHQLKEARSLLEHVARKWPDRPDAVIAMADVEYHEARWEQGLELISRLLEKSPHLIRARLSQAQFLCRLNRLDDAEHAYRRALLDYPNDEGALLNLGNLALERGKFNEAAGYFDQAILNSDSEDANIGITESYLYSGQCRSAELSAIRGLRIQFSSFILTGLAADALACQGYQHESLSYFARAVELGNAQRDPGIGLSGDTCLRLARYEARLQNWTKAREYLATAKAQGIAPDLLVYGDAVITLLEGNFAKAQELRKDSVSRGFPKAFAEADPVWRVTTVWTAPKAPMRPRSVDGKRLTNYRQSG